MLIIVGFPDLAHGILDDQHELLPGEFSAEKTGYSA
jgi:hypothetical protein